MPIEHLEKNLENQVQKIGSYLTSICSLLGLNPKVVPVNLFSLQENFTTLAHQKGFTEFNQVNFCDSIRKAEMSGILGEELDCLGKYIHQLIDAQTLVTWIKDGTAVAILKDLQQFHEAYEIAYRLKTAKTVSHDANVTNYLVDGEGQLTRIDLVDFLSRGQRIYDLTANLRNSCPQTDNTVVCLERAKIMVEQFDNRTRLSSGEVKSLFSLFKAVELGNKPHGLATLMSRAAQIDKLGNPNYDNGINIQFSLDKKKKVIDLDNQRIARNDLTQMVEESREQTVRALNLRTASKKPSTIIGPHGLFRAPAKQQKGMLDSVEYEVKPFDQTSMYDKDGEKVLSVYALTK